MTNLRKYFQQDRIYSEKCMSQRKEIGGAGSYFDKDINLSTLMAAEWTEITYPEGVLSPGCIAYKATIPGYVGVVPLASLNPKEHVSLLDFKGTGKYSITVKRNRNELPRVDFTIVILGPGGEKYGEKVLYTFHPGDPHRETILEKDQIQGIETVEDAIAAGKEYAKIVS